MSEKTGRKRTRLLTATILFGSIVSLLEAAIPTGTVVGNVRDESGAIIPGAKVTITHQGTGAVRSMQTPETTISRCCLSVPTRSRLRCKGSRPSSRRNFYFRSTRT